VGLTGSAEVVDAVVLVAWPEEANWVSEVMLKPGDENWISEAAPPPPLASIVLLDAFGLIAWILPVELDADMLAASVAAVERSPATAANEA
jgi:hypothetical protein